MDQRLVYSQPADPGAGAIDAQAAENARRLEIWRHCVLNFPFMLGGSQWVGASSPITTQPESIDGWLTLTLSSERYHFNAVISEATVNAGLKPHHPGVDITLMAPEDLGLVIEQVMADPLAQLENFLGTYQEISEIRKTVPADIDANSLQFKINSIDENHIGFLNIVSPLAERITERVAHFSSVDEKKVNDRLSVVIGPIALDTNAFSSVDVGEIIDCGVQPSDTIRGFLLRSDNRYWPGFVEDTEFLISGPHLPLDFSAARKAGKTLVSLQFAETYVGAVDRLGLSEGDRVSVNRFDGNEVIVFANDQEHGTGRLMVHQGNLAVGILSLKVAE